MFKNMIPLNVKCPLCKKELMDKEVKLDDWPAIVLKYNMDGRIGKIWLSSLYGSYALKSEMPIQDKRIISFICPHCRAELKSQRKCEICSAEMVPLELIMGGDVEFCSRKGCKNHILEFKTLEEAAQFYELYELYFKPAP